MVTITSMWTRVTHWLNVLIWSAPAPRKLQKSLSALVYNNPPMPAARVLEILRALEEAELDVWVMGGWGLDALAGRQHRTHRDLDLIVEQRDLKEAVRVLGTAGFDEWHRHPPDPDEPIGDLRATGDNVCFRDKGLRVVDLHALAVRESGEQFATGSIDGVRVRCLTARQQLRALEIYGDRLPREPRRRRNYLASVEIARRLDGVSGHRSSG